MLDKFAYAAIQEKAHWRACKTYNGKLQGPVLLIHCLVLLVWTTDLYARFIQQCSVAYLAQVSLREDIYLALCAPSPSELALAALHWRGRRGGAGGVRLHRLERIFLKQNATPKILPPKKTVLPGADRPLLGMPLTMLKHLEYIICSCGSQPGVRAYPGVWTRTFRVGKATFVSMLLCMCTKDGELIGCQGAWSKSWTMTSLSPTGCLFLRSCPEQQQQQSLCLLIILWVLLLLLLTLLSLLFIGCSCGLYLHRVKRSLVLRIYHALILANRKDTIYGNGLQRLETTET